MKPIKNFPCFVWFNDDITFLSSSETTFALSMGSYTDEYMGGSDTGVFAYLPDLGIGGDDAIWTHAGVFIAEKDDAPVYAGVELIHFLGSPKMLANGYISYIATIDDDANGSADTRAFFINDGTTTTVPIKSGDTIGAETVSSVSYAIYTDYGISSDVNHWIVFADMDTGSSLTDGMVVVDGAAAAQEDSDSGVTSHPWDNFDGYAINNSGNYLFSGDTSGAGAEDEFVAYNGTIAVREGDTIDQAYVLLLDAQRVIGPAEEVPRNRTWSVHVGTTVIVRTGSIPV